MLIKYTGKYVNIYFIMKITFLSCIPFVGLLDTPPLSLTSYLHFMDWNINDFYDLRFDRCLHSMTSGIIVHFCCVPFRNYFITARFTRV